MTIGTDFLIIRKKVRKKEEGIMRGSDEMFWNNDPNPYGVE